MEKNKTLNSTFFTVYRKKGFCETIEILGNSKEKQMLEKEFYNKLKEKKIPLNYFYRSKEDLINYTIISYNLDKNFNKIIILTEKGKKIYQKLKLIEDLLQKDL